MQEYLKEDRNLTSEIIRVYSAFIFMFERSGFECWSDLMGLLRFSNEVLPMVFNFIPIRELLELHSIVLASSKITAIVN